MTVDQQTHFLDQIRKTYPELEIDSVCLHTSEGQYNDILFINEALVFRFPRFEENIRKSKTLVRLLNAIQPHLSLAIPNPTYANMETAEIGKFFFGYPIIEGQPFWHEVWEAIDSRSQNFIGVIDFDFSRIGDPAVDVAGIAGLSTKDGSLFVERMYGVYPEIESMWDRINFYRSTFALQEALYGIKEGDEGAFQRGIEQYT